MTREDVGGCGCGPGTITCFPCDLPEDDLTMSWTGGGSAPLYYDIATTRWISDPDVVPSEPGTWRLTCTGGLITLTFDPDYPAAPGAPNCTLTRQGDSTCTPFHIHFKPPVGVSVTCTDLLTNGYSDFYVDYP